jgi:hypothetical protein
MATRRPGGRSLAIALTVFVVTGAIGATVACAVASSGAAGPPRIAVQVDPGWSPADRAVLERIVDAVLPVVEEVTGPPAGTRTIIIRGGASGRTCTASDGIELGRGGPLDAALAECVTHEIVHSFHDHAGLPDGLEEGATVVTTALVLSRVAEALGLDPIVPEPAQVTVEGVALSSSAAADLVDDPSLAVQPWLGADGTAPPGATDMYGVAGAFWMALRAERPTVLHDFYARWNGTLPGLRPAPEEILGELVPTVGGIPFTEWRLGGWWAVRTSHAPGVSVRCADLSPQLDRVPGAEGARAFRGLVRIVETDAAGRMRPIEGTVSVRILSADGTEIAASPYALGAVTGTGPDERLPAPPAPGAYRLSFSVAHGGVTVDAGSCWLTAGIRGAGRVLVVGEPGLEVAVSYPATASGGYGEQRVRRTVRIREDGVADLGPAGTGIVVVTTRNGLRKAVPIGPAGVEVAVSEP